MKLQLDTTVQIHKLLNPPTDTVNSQLSQLVERAESVTASTYSKKEFAFSLIKDLCTMLARVSRTKSLKDALDFIDKYGSLRKRFRGRMLAVFWKFFIRQTVRGNLSKYDDNKRDTIFAEKFAEFLRLYIPVFWESFEEGLELPLPDRTKCPFAHRAPIDNGKTFVLNTKRKCDSSYNCTLPNLIKGERDRALKLLEKLNSINDNDNTDELKKIQLVIKNFFEEDNTSISYEMCNQGIGDLIIALETPLDRTLITTNAKESHVISPAISQEYIVLSTQ